jgi:hypothetical protein
MRRLDCHDQLKQVSRHYSTSIRAMKTLVDLCQENPDHLRRGKLDLIELREVATQLHEVYFVRLFASFESILRNYWKMGLKRNTRPVTEHLVGSIATRRQVPQDALDLIQEIRDFRNSLVHDEHQVHRPFTIEEASGHLNSFLARLPNEW